jgi:hypothetical protein
VQSAKLSVENPRNFGKQYDTDLSFQFPTHVTGVHITVPFITVPFITHSEASTTFK